jgi:peroxiredoxin Q/BCP
MLYLKRFSAALGTLIMSLSVLAAGPADFTVTSPIDDGTFRLSEAKGRYVALHFLLKTECPVCLRHTAEYSMKAPTLAGVHHVFLKPDSDAEIKSWSGKIKGSQPTIYRDADAKLAKEFGIPDGYKFHGQTMHYPALVLLDPSGREVFRHVGRNNTDRYSWDKFAAKISELGANPALKDYHLSPDKVALSGYDPVAYFTHSKALKGSAEIHSLYRGVTYCFATDQNRAQFAAAPEKYLPTYGGWCATAMARGEKIEIDPTNFKVTNGRLFLFFKAFYGNALNDWKKKEPALTIRADAHWKRIAGE